MLIAIFPGQRLNYRSKSVDFALQNLSVKPLEVLLLDWDGIGFVTRIGDRLGDQGIYLTGSNSVISQLCAEAQTGQKFGDELDRTLVGLGV